MCTLGRTATGTARKADNKPNRTRIPVWDDQERNDNGAKRCRCHFLTIPIRPIAPKYLLGGWNNDRYELITQENYEFLRDSYLRYAELMGVLPKHTPGKTIGEGINNAYNEMLELIGDNPKLNIEDNHGQLYFNLWSYHKWGRYVVYYFPVKFIENLCPVLKRITISFLNVLMNNNGISTIIDEFDLDTVLDWMSGEDCQNRDEIKKAEELVCSYRGGKAYRLLETVRTKSYYKNVRVAINRYIPRNDFEISLIDSMKDGIDFLYPDKGIMYYAYDPFLDEDRDYPPITLDRQIRMVYDIDDPITNGLLDYLNCEQQETYEIIPTACKPLSPQTDRLFSVQDTYPERFFQWASKFIDITS